MRVTQQRATSGYVRLLLLLMSIVAAHPAWSRCTDWTPFAKRSAVTRPIAASDLLGIAGIGRPDSEPIGGPSPLAISPDGETAAFLIARADTATNRYCQALVLIDLKNSGPPRIVDRGGDFIMTEVVARGLYIPNGFPRQIVPVWSADGRSIAYLRRAHGATHIRLVSVATGKARDIISQAGDVASFAWMPGDKRIGFAAEARRHMMERQINAASRRGWLYDERVTPNTSWRPQPKAPVANSYKVVTLASGRVTDATDQEVRLIRANADRAANPEKARAGEASASTEPTAPSPLSARRLQVTDRNGREVRCDQPACTGTFAGMWWKGGGTTLIFLKREGWDHRYTALYRWLPATGAPRRMLRTDDLLERCQMHLRKLLCLHETATHPADIVQIAPQTGKIETLFDPNQAFDRLDLGHVKRLTWRNALGLEVYGDLVLPPGYRGDRPLPTIVTLYHSRGFLRGGTGNEYPVFLFAQRGFAVLSIERPAIFAERFPELTTFDAINAADLENWSERRSVQSAIATGIERLVTRGIADPRRLGITGLSDGASAARFALINSDLFAAASISSCCVDESAPALAGPAWAEYSRKIGYPPAYPVDNEFWRPYSFVRNARRMDTPLLLQLADSESLYALPTITALRQYHQPVEMRVFPDEFHIKWQPAHRAAIYQTNLDWFDFWLNGKIDPAPEKTDEYRRWRRLRANHQQNGSTRSNRDP
ncbi:Atxe2 family lasso peptide isopeptidase [Stakelama saccharophila]|uniref:Atxe2 family lasso peptide isopeptidase n=1 Tax=Stakelama saccharophila TaxID=3075605 RepID=A0ABZ0B7Q7_9SPHN|nr:Atxe2 family lasso peptide isopeptidase [Stakelama sp. W311]WNO53451.1 Atxe2 family lasso peptide isopeptidase [Stakelama sp. W311]